LWCGLIVLYTFPNGHFSPRWTFWLAVLVVPLTFFMAFSTNIFLSPDNWPDPLNLLPNIIFIGGGLFAVLYRYWGSMDLAKRRRLRSYVDSLTLLLAAYFVDFVINQVYPLLAGQLLIQGFRAGMTYALVYEPVWYILQVNFAIALAVSVFRDKVLEA
jgi:hypothetical protein